MSKKGIPLKIYGSVLTGREFGAEVWKQISKELKVPSDLDFDGVETIGSSFGDEVIPPLAKTQGNKVTLHNVNDDMKAIIEDVASDAGIQVTFK
jgi:hypothetical protein